ncbi:glycoside hydrolase family 65 protein [Nocardia huaxiensis]|uniref:Glycoside hydrolase family 65 protein n=1 Tax=Nocardia huaxiensis TaxID=2755382 RepID=A0A7D6Z526_9NOCA|nr:glycoside hydrolase family 65 protein [Nocardia huaxiensis]QLY33106.1 glycoside hydrolase family 65 protein [Nocardia huaxiensis]UFS93124.1 family 65 glycosyl hydrolase [Nocardia huaxiensis]
MIDCNPGFDVAPWHLRWCGLDLDALLRTESIFALSNGHLGLRGTLEEGEPVGQPGTYLNGYYEKRQLPYAETGYGYPEVGQSIVNVTDGKIIRLLVADEPMDMRYGKALEHERVLDFRSGTLRRNTVWSSPTGRTVRIRSERLVSFTDRAIAAIRYEVEPLDGEIDLVVQSDLLANEPAAATTRDPRLAAALDRPLVADFATARDYSALLAHHTRHSGLRMAAGIDHELELPGPARCSVQVEDDLARVTIAVDVAQGDRLRLTKYIAYGWSSRRSTPALRAQVAAALAAGMETGWDTLLRRQRDYLDEFWATADIEIDGDPELQQAVRFALFHVLQAGARGESRAIPAKGLTGPGYDGHAFWDTETFVLPVLTCTVPSAAGQALRWRHSTLDTARRRARELGQSGVMFPWRSINGEEGSGYWPTGTAAVHVNADIADATARYLAATDDEEFETDCGVELLVETARLWAGLGHHNSSGDFRIDGVTGPDEYSALADNNVYTNLMAQRNLREAAAACARRPEMADKFGVTPEETARWHDCADRMALPYNEKLGVHEQSEGFTRYARWDFAATTATNYPLLLNYPYFELYRKQVVKQADLVLAMQLCPTVFTAEQKARNFDYYDALTVRDSSLSACTQAVLAAEVGHLSLAFDYFVEAALTDLHDLHHNVAHGLHIASLAGTWLCCVGGFGGLRDCGKDLFFAPRLPDQLDRLTFRIAWRGRRLAVEITADSATYSLLGGDSIRLSHHGRDFTLDADPVTLPIPFLRSRPAPELPDGRRPYRRF